MERLRIQKSPPLQGTVRVSGAKNAALPILISTLLTDEPCIIQNVPNLADIRTTQKVLEGLDVQVAYNREAHEWKSQTLPMPHPSCEAPYDLVRTMRASILVLGPLLAKRGHAKVSLPGGCAIGARPVDYHLTALEKLGAEIKIENGFVIAQVPKKLKGATIDFPFPSVGATENLMMAATLAEGSTILKNAAREPEIVDLAKALRSMGADISGEGTSEIQIQGQNKLQGMHHSIQGDRIEAGTLLCAALITRGSVTLTGIHSESMGVVLPCFEKMGAKIETHEDTLTLKSGKEILPLSLETQPFPGFPTDMQAQFMAVMTQAQGISVVSETIFENRFMHVPELSRLGAKIEIKGNEAKVHGSTKLSGAIVMATDLRASASLVLAGLIAEGETIVRRIYHLDRGYESLELKLQSLGANIVRELEK